ncbi:MAG TPA: hypothetical protein VNL16_18125 [Chloroflexota bacterium]|nr:hypothetical protein [Chloroflexota bacterium]
MAEPSPVSSEGLTTNSLEEEIRTLESRLRNGEEYLRLRKDAGGDHESLARLEAGWIKLLRQYELLCDRRQRQSAHRRSSSIAERG